MNLKAGFLLAGCPVVPWIGRGDRVAETAAAVGNGLCPGSQVSNIDLAVTVPATLFMSSWSQYIYSKEYPCNDYKTTTEGR